MNDKAIMLAVLGLLVAIFSAWFLMTHERVDKEVRTPSAPAVRANNYYGFQQYLDKLEIPNQRIFDLNIQNQLPPVEDTLVLNDKSFDSDDLKELLSWVASGGHLVMRGNYETDRQSLPAKLGLAMLERMPTDYGNPLDPYDESQEDKEIIDGDTEDVDKPKEPAEEDWTGDEDLDSVYVVKLEEEAVGRMRIYPPYSHLGRSERPHEWELLFSDPEDTEREPGRLAVGYRYGLGSISVITATGMAYNEYFHKLDNAHVFYNVIRSSRSSAKVWLVNNVLRSSIFDLLWNRAAHLLVWLALSIVFFFWWAGQRFGRMLPEPFQGRREYAEHIAASARFLWKNSNHATLVDEARDALNFQVDKRFPHLREVSVERRREHMQQFLGNDIRLWDLAHQPLGELNRSKFLEQIKAIQTLWTRI